MVFTEELETEAQVTKCRRLVGPQFVRVDIIKDSTRKCKVCFHGGFFFALCCLGKIPGGAPFSQLHKSGNGSRVDRP